jgi:hypothetical protein
MRSLGDRDVVAPKAASYSVDLNPKSESRSHPIFLLVVHSPSLWTFLRSFAPRFASGFSVLDPSVPKEDGLQCPMTEAATTPQPKRPAGTKMTSFQRQKMNSRISRHLQLSPLSFLDSAPSTPRTRSRRSSLGSRHCGCTLRRARPEGPCATLFSPFAPVGLDPRASQRLDFPTAIIHTSDVSLNFRATCPVPIFIAYP